MKCFTACVTLVASLVLASPVNAEPIKNIVLVHGAWVDGSGWKPVSDTLTKQGFRVSVVQIPETSFADDVAAT
jgi:hypothetical protein